MSDTIQEVNGYLEIFNQGYAFLRSAENNFRPSNDDIFVSSEMIRLHALREGVRISGTINMNHGSEKQKPQLQTITTINNLPPDQYKNIRELRHLTSINPEERLYMQVNEKDRRGAILDFVTPFGKGQRGLIISPPKTGKTTILKHIGRAILTHQPEMQLIVLLVDERPEEVTDFRRSLPGSLVLSSSADESVQNHVRITRLTMNMAMRQAEAGHDVVVLIDSLTRMARAFNKESYNHGRTLSGGLAANALELPRRFFGAGRKIEFGGSLTVMATILINTGSLMDDIIYQEFKGTGNLDLVLSQACAERRIYPAININESSTRKEHLLLSDEQARESYKLRRVLGGLREAEAMSYLMDHLDPVEAFHQKMG